MITLDNNLNEYFKNSSPWLVRVLYRISNLILDTGIIPENWTLDMNKLVYKDTGNSTDLDNFSAITLICCLGKLFSSILNERLTFFTNDISLISFN